mmetsp:Transcript_31886/g.5768  ORF Transcript_31886/g.5768 Transcript_31886/m.5768 type:complete len:86 (+) Transcript_31886:426-683(+)|eukprot:CAMPEP_0168314922 /NCGR_PEP_ID=MMETSP0210-20121227/9718_1 /TAXON_ID=40633 /ORGANISM="Condylostoma magnum, Strain COL2" /LENGTH=85 /DNA_ID=CAMNT_0008285549 /DNA_START=420 /DNA_END=677 /DNA_ORIENTATION=+
MPQSSLSLFSTGRTRGMLVEMGDGLTSIVPVFEGYGLPHAVKKMQVAGSDITGYVLKGIEQLKPTQFDVARLIKEKMVIIPIDYD